MIAGCPKCSARYRIDPGKLGPEGARLRCTQCEAVFRVAPPAPAGAPAADDAPPAPASRPAATGGPPPASAPAPAAPAASGPIVLIADPDVASAKATANAVGGWGFQPLLVHDGVEAVLTIQRSLPAVVVLDAALPKMFGFQICELVKRNEQLHGIHVVLVGAIHDEDRYRRAPSELYGADDYVERPQLPEALRPLLARFLEPGAAGGAAVRTPVDPAAAEPRPAPAPPAGPAVARPAEPAPAQAAPTPAAPAEPTQAAPTPVAPAQPVQAAPTPAAPAEPTQAAPTPVAPAQPVQAAPTPVAPAEPTLAAPTPAQPETGGGAADGTDPEVVAAERLARIVVSDIVLYNPEKFESGVQNGNVVQVLSAELDEGRSLFEMRVDSKIRESRDFLAEELVRVARSRGMA